MANTTQNRLQTLQATDGVACVRWGEGGKGATGRTASASEVKLQMGLC